MKKSIKYLTVLLFIIQFVMLNKIKAQVIEAAPKQFLEMVIGINNNRNKQTFKSGDDSALLLDSVIQYIDLGNLEEYYKWHYDYNFAGNLIQNKRYTYNAVNEWLKITQTTQFNNFGLPSYYSITMPSYISNPNSSDTAIIEQKNIKYTYNNNSYLVEYEENYWEYGDHLSYKESYIRDSNNRLLLKIDKKIYTDGSSYPDSTEYIYNDEGQLTYKLIKNRSVNKYTYVKTDSSLTTINNFAYFFEIGDWETNTNWLQTITTEKKYNTRNLLVKYSSSTDGYYAQSYNFYATFCYNDNNQLIHASYYKPNEVLIGEEQMRIDYTYDENGNTLLYEMTCYDDNFNNWQITEQKKYYYNMHAVGNTMNKNSQFSIYPNPTSDVLYLKNTGNGTFSIYTFNGRLKIRGNLNEKIVDLSRLPKGVYLFVSKANGNIITEKFMKN